VSRTRALDFLVKAGVDHVLHHYDVDISESHYGEAVAAALGADPARVFKTLVAVVDGHPVIAIIPVGSQLSLKQLATAAGGKKAVMATPADAERWTGYLVGGISPFGQKRSLPTFLDDSALSLQTVYVSAGQRGLQVELAPQVIEDLLGAKVVPLV
jgi:Cys-tRNA(Pro)/Cys-tRNA(Cys) deacylase